MTKTVSIALVGLGNVGRNVLELLIAKEERIRKRYDLEFRIVGAADSSGAALFTAEGSRAAFVLGPKPEGLDARALLQLKKSNQGAAALPKHGQPGMGAAQMLEKCGAEVLLELSPTNLDDGQPGLGACEKAVERGMHIVLANKGPLVLAYPRLAAAAERKHVRLAFSATVAGGLPTVNIGRRDLGVATIERIEGVLNGTTNFIITSMAENGMSYAEALKIAQERGIAETDPTLDVEGYDAANKLLILAHATLDHHATLKDVEITGITRVTMDDLAHAKAEGKVMKLLCVAERSGDAYRLSVKPTALPAAHPMARLSADQMGIVYTTDINGEIVAYIEEGNPLPTAAAVVRDLVNVVASQ